MPTTLQLDEQDRRTKLELLLHPYTSCNLGVTLPPRPCLDEWVGPLMAASKEVVTVVAVAAVAAAGTMTPAVQHLDEVDWPCLA